MYWSLRDQALHEDLGLAGVHHGHGAGGGLGVGRFLHDRELGRVQLLGLAGGPDGGLVPDQRGLDEAQAHGLPDGGDGVRVVGPGGDQPLARDATSRLR